MSSQPNDVPAREDEPAASTPAVSTPAPFRAQSAGPEVARLASQDLSLPGTAKPPWKAAADGRTVFRRGTPLVIFWAWVAFAIYNIAQIAIPDHDYFSIELTVGLLAVTGIVYATTVRPRVITDDAGVSVCNPYQDHRIGWGGLNAVYLGDSVEFSCARQEPRKDKTVYSWALYSGRRSRMRGRMRVERSRTRGFGGAFGLSSRAPVEAQELARQDTVQLMAAEIGRRCNDARGAGTPPAFLQSVWAWLPMAYAAAPAAALLGLLLAR